MAKNNKPKKEDLLEYPKDQDLFTINAQDANIKKYQPEFLNIVNMHGHGNDADIVGMVSQVIKDYRNSTKSPSLDGWKKYHRNRQDIKGIEVGVEKNWTQFEKMKEAINTIDKETIRYWLENLVYNKTFAGLQAQDMVLQDIAKRLNEKGKGYGYYNGDANDERAQIDGYITRLDGKVCGLQIKSDSYRSHNTIEGIAPVKYVYYKLYPGGLYYDFNLDDLSFVDKDSYEVFKERAIEEEQKKKTKKEEKKKHQEEKEQKRTEREKRRIEKASTQKNSR